MNNLHTTSETPEKNCPINIYHEDDDPTLVYYDKHMEGIYHFGTKHFDKWEELKIIGWRYLDEKVELVWKGNTEFSHTAAIGHCELHATGDGKGWYWTVVFHDAALVINQQAKSLKQAQSAAIEWYNENVANLSEANHG